MKKIISSISAVLILGFSGLTLADSVVIQQTSTWPSVPITVDTTAHTYTVSGTVPTGSTQYYYSYPGYRCFAEKRDFVGINALVFSAGVSGGTDIYCYPE